ncbi:unnamed protein product [Agarophyton chilense]
MLNSGVNTSGIVALAGKSTPEAQKVPIAALVNIMVELWSSGKYVSTSVKFLTRIEAYWFGRPSTDVAIEYPSAERHPRYGVIPSVKTDMLNWKQVGSLGRITSSIPFELMRAMLEFKRNSESLACPTAPAKNW